jgi:hypothetical protein
VDLEVVSACIKAMLAAGVVERAGRTLVIGEALSVDTSTSTEAFVAVRQHWLQVAGTRVRDALDTDVFGYNVISVSRADLARIRELELGLFREIRAIVAASEPTEVAALVGVQLVEWRS